MITVEKITRQEMNWKLVKKKKCLPDREPLLIWLIWFAISFLTSRIICL